MLHFNKPIQIRSMLADIFQDRFAENLEKAKEEKRRRQEAISAASSTGTFTVQARKSSVS